MSTYNHFTAKPSYLFGSPLVPQPSLILRLVFIIDHGYQLQFDYLLGLCPLRWWIENVEARRVQPTGSDPSMVNRTYVDGRVQVSDPQFFLVHWLCNITKIHVGLLDDLIMSRPVFFSICPPCQQVWWPCSPRISSLSTALCRVHLLAAPEQPCAVADRNLAFTNIFVVFSNLN